MRTSAHTCSEKFVKRHWQTSKEFKIPFEKKKKTSDFFERSFEKSTIFLHVPVRGKLHAITYLWQKRSFFWRKFLDLEERKKSIIFWEEHFRLIPQHEALNATQNASGSMLSDQTLFKHLLCNSHTTRHASTTHQNREICKFMPLPTPKFDFLIFLRRHFDGSNATGELTTDRWLHASSWWYCVISTTVLPHECVFVEMYIDKNSKWDGGGILQSGGGGVAAITSFQNAASDLLMLKCNKCFKLCWILWIGCDWFLTQSAWGHIVNFCCNV